MRENSLKQLARWGQSIWLDDIGREMIRSGELRGLIEEDGLRGMTSNPAIFEKAIVESDAYEEEIRAAAHEGKSVEAIYEALILHDVQSAADEFREVYDSSGSSDGYVSLEVNPHLAHDTAGTIAEARHLWAALDRPNVFIKVPATREGLPAITQLIREGINVNVTLLFGLPRYREVAEAYLRGIEERLSQGESVASIASVASFFVSRMDSLVDPLLEKMAAKGGDAQSELSSELTGEVAVANAKAAYQLYKEIFGGEYFHHLMQRGARVQRVLWASTSTKNPRYPDVKYIEALIGPETVNTVPKETLKAYRDHGRPEPRLEHALDQAYWVLEQLPSVGIHMADVTQQLEDEGVEKFIAPYDKLLQTLASVRITN